MQTSQQREFKEYIDNTQVSIWVVKHTLPLRKPAPVYLTVFDIPYRADGYFEMDDYGNAVIIPYCYASAYFYALQPNWRYHC